MDILGIGPLEIAFILLLVIVIFGPKDLAKAGKTIGQFLNKLVRSDTWKAVNQTTRELKNLPNRLMREAGLDELDKMNKGGVAPIDNVILPQKGPRPTPEKPPVIIPGPEFPPKSNPAPSVQSDPLETPDKDPFA
jgi:Sec-independent protein translocase protein TatA